MTKYKGNDIEKQHKIIPVGRAKDIIGQRFGRLEVKGRVENKNKRTFWLCECDCGNYKEVSTASLRAGDTVSCGCKRAELTTPHDITDEKFGRLTAVKLLDRRSASGDAYWECKCECGNTSEVQKSSLSNGYVKSCGCLARELSSERQKESGHKLRGKKFGRLTVREPVGKREGYGRLWLCDCECGGTITTNASDIVGGRTTSCGCKQIEHVTALGLGNVGKNNPAYNHNLTKEDREAYRFQRTSSDARRLRAETYKRDEFKCTLCGSNKGIVAHHLDGFDNHPDKRFDIHNLTTLCNECHVKFHREFGYGNNTKEQFKEFKQNAKLEEYTKALV